MRYKIDPLTKEEFVPTRQNQVYKNRKNQVAANNKRLNERREGKYYIDQILQNNREILIKSIGGLKEITIPIQALIEQGFVMGYSTHFQRNNLGETTPCLYEFGISQINNKIKITKQNG